MSPAIAIGAAWGVLSAAWLWSVTAPTRVPLVESGSKPEGSAFVVAAWARVGGLARAGLAALGRPTRRLAGPARTHDRKEAARRDQVLGLALLAGFLLAAGLHPLVGLLTVVIPLATPRWRARTLARRKTTAVIDQLPDIVDLLRLTTLAGLPVSAAIVAIGRRPGGVVGDALQHAATQLGHGASTIDAVKVFAARCGTPARPLGDALVDHGRYGTPLAPVLDRMAVEYRLRRRQQAEEAARRLPVTLLFPLVLTTLPACALLTIVPLLVASFSSLQL